MQNLLLLLLMGFVGTANAQNKIVERKQTTENGVTKGWTITKELDDNGDMISYDSTYFEQDASQNNNGMIEFNFDGLGDTQFQYFNFGTDSIQMNSFFNQLGMTDSLFQQQFFDLDQLLEQYKKQMDQFYLPPEQVPSDSTQFIYPENGKIKKI